MEPFSSEVGRTKITQAEDMGISANSPTRKVTAGSWSQD